MTKERSVFLNIKNICGFDGIYTFDVGEISYKVNGNKNTLKSNFKGFIPYKMEYSLHKELIHRPVNRGRTDNHGGCYLTCSIGSLAVRMHRLISFLKYGELIFRPGTEIDHDDGDRENNSEKNLLISNRILNAKNASKRGAFNGVNKYGGKLKKIDVENIITAINNGERNRDLAIEYDVNQSIISNIRHGKRT